MAKLGYLIYESAMNRVPTEYSSLSVKEREDAIREKMFEVLGIDKYEKKSFRRAMRKHAAEVYEIIEDVATQILNNGDYAKNEFFNSFVELKNEALGDTNEFYIEGENSLEVVEFSGSHFNANRKRYDAGEKFGVEVKDYIVSCFEYAERIASGRVDFAKIIADMTVAINDKLSETAQTTFAAALASLPSVFTVSGSFVEQDILALSAHVQAATGEKPYAVGTAVALSKLQGKKDLSYYSDGMKEELNKNGRLSVWNGITCVELAQGHKKGTFDFTMDDKVVYFLSGGEKPVKMFLEGDAEYREVGATWDGRENADKSVEQEITYKAGCAVMYNKMLGKVVFA